MTIPGRIDESHLEKILPLVTFFLLLGVWYFIYFALPDTFATPGQTMGALYEQIVSGELPEALVLGLRVILLGFASAAVVGILLGSIMGLNPRVEQALDSYVYATYVAPLPALVPALIAWFGTGFTLRWFVIFLFALFPITINTLQGTKNRPTELIDAARSFEADTLFIYRHVILPNQIGYIMAGLRLGIMRAIKVLVVVELLVSVTGFGRIISEWAVAFRIEGVLSVVLVLMILGVLATWGLRLLERRYVHW